MHFTWTDFLWLLALIQFALAALNVPGFPRWSWTPGGLFCATLALTKWTVGG